MDKNSFVTIIIVSFLVYFYIEVYYDFVFTLIYKNLKNVSTVFTKKLTGVLFKNNVFLFINLFLFLYTLTLKDNYNNFLLSSVLVLSIVTLFLKKSKNNIVFLNFNLIIFLLVASKINNYLSFFLFMEIYSIFFYFFFLHSNSTNIKNFLQFKNNLLLYLFNNFLTTIFFLVGLAGLIDSFGVLNFSELKCLTIEEKLNWKSYFLILGFIIKISLPGFHFIKLEIYKYLTLDVVITFSVVTLYLNYILIIFFFNNNIFSYLIFKYNFIVILLIIGFFVIIQKLNINNLNEFVAYSGFATNNLIILNFIKKWLYYV